MQRSKIQLSAEELELVQNSQWILTKNRVIEKVYDLFGSISQQMQDELQSTDLILPEAAANGPKISRGEKYAGLPYVMLDCPRLFRRTTILAIRSFFWWGKSLSVTLHLKGEAQALSSQTIAGYYDLLAKEQFFIAVGGDEWRHDFEPDNFIPVQQLTREKFREILENHPFLKLGFVFSLAQWSNADQIIFEKFRLLLKLVQADR